MDPYTKMHILYRYGAVSGDASGCRSTPVPNPASPPLVELPCVRVVAGVTVTPRLPSEDRSSLRSPL